MSNWRVVEAPAFPPYKCVACPTIKGPIIDTLVDIALLPNGGRVYLCKNCAKLAAVEFGFADGEAADELMEASETLKLYAKELQDIKEMAVKKDELIESQHHEQVQLQEDLARERQKTDQLQATLDEIRGVASGTQETTT